MEEQRYFSERHTLAYCAFRHDLPVSYAGFPVQVDGLGIVCAGN